MDKSYGHELNDVGLSFVKHLTVIKYVMGKLS